jgi:hypothetical protein
MKHKLILILTLLFLVNNIHAQDLDKLSKQVLNEGLELYKLESANRMAMQNITDRAIASSASGEISYKDSNNLHVILWKAGIDKPAVIQCFTFSDTVDKTHLIIDTKERDASELETWLISISNSLNTLFLKDTMFKYYDHVSFFTDYIVHQKTVDAYVMSSSEVRGAIVLGNDYKITFDENAKAIAKQKIHSEISSINYVDFKKDGISIAAFHHHTNSDPPFITSTDVCNALLQKPESYLQELVVGSAKYTSVFDLDNLQLQIAAK